MLPLLLAAASFFPDTARIESANGEADELADTVVTGRFLGEAGSGSGSGEPMKPPPMMPPPPPPMTPPSASPSPPPTGSPTPPPYSPGVEPVEVVTLGFSTTADFDEGAIKSAFAAAAGVDDDDVLVTQTAGLIAVVIKVPTDMTADAIVSTFSDAEIIETAEEALGDDADITVSLTASSQVVPSSDLPEDDDDDLSGGAIAGIVIGVFIGVFMLGAGVYYMMNRDPDGSLSLQQKHEKDVELQGNSKV